MMLLHLLLRVAPTATPSSCRSYGRNPFIQSYLFTESPPFRNASPAVAVYGRRRILFPRAVARGSTLANSR